MEENKQGFIGTREAARIAGYHPVYLTKLVRLGIIPGYKRGQWRISKSELLAFIAAGSNQGINQLKTEDKTNGK
jgi:hypothetical protein